MSFLGFRQTSEIKKNICKVFQFNGTLFSIKHQFLILFYLIFPKGYVCLITHSKKLKNYQEKNSSWSKMIKITGFKNLNVFGFRDTEILLFRYCIPFIHNIIRRNICILINLLYWIKFCPLIKTILQYCISVTENLNK